MSRCPGGHWWWPWHRYRFDGYVPGDLGAYKLQCKRCPNRVTVYG